MNAAWSPLNPLEKAFAQLLGLQLSYVNNDGIEIFLQPGIFDKIGRELLPTGLEFSGEWNEAFLEKLVRHQFSRKLPENAVVWEGSELVITCQSIEDRPFESLHGEIVLENGEKKSFEVRGIVWNEIPSPFSPFLTLRVREAKVATGLRLPPGYHLLKSLDGEECQIIGAPEKIPAAREKTWGTFVPAYALRSASDWGSGSYTELEKFSTWLAGFGAKTVATLPLLPNFLEDWKCDPSPYSPASRLFWNEFYIDVELAPEWKTSTEARALVKENAQNIRVWRESEHVPYFEIAQLKRKVLELLACEYFSQPDRQRLARVEREKPGLLEYARFRAHCFEKKASWWTWNEREKSSLDGAEIDQRFIEFYLYSQMLACEQVSLLADRCRSKGLSFYLDLPVGVDSDSYDVWKNPKQYCLKLSAGAPPDPFFTKGQNWGFPPLRPSTLKNNRLAHFKEILRHHLSHASLLRLDHVMGFHRIYVVPHGEGADRGAYIRFPFEELYAVLILEATRAGARLVGEDLGTVPEEVRREMDAHLLSRLFVFQYEAHTSKDRIVNPAAANTVATLNTHDMPMWAAYWAGLDLPDRLDLGLLDAKSMLEEEKNRELLRDRWTQILRQDQGLDDAASPQEIFEATMLSLAKSDSELALVTLEDIWGEQRPQNTPGTYMERKNWQRKCLLSLEECENDAGLGDFLKKFSNARST